MPPSTGARVETRRNYAVKQSQANEEQLMAEPSSQRNKSHTKSVFPKTNRLRSNPTPSIFMLEKRSSLMIEKKSEDETAQDEERKR
ncbi:hypothetical protein F2Q70_00044294 [Brassica cretica]|uniref:Uncharacterized protein n=1 Tax=Brassica cretica TaxID=69181 RepID=A0A8S9KLE4_BRACR|nr:hypothetical protein F2Q70_00044294 [Brassica cretica]